MARSMQILSPSGEKTEQMPSDKNVEELADNFVFDEESVSTDDDIPF